MESKTPNKTLKKKRKNGDMKRYITCKKWRIEEEERKDTRSERDGERDTKEGEQTHILPGGEDWTLPKIL